MFTQVRSFGSLFRQRARPYWPTAIWLTTIATVTQDFLNHLSVRQFDQGPHILDMTRDQLHRPLGSASPISDCYDFATRQLLL